MDDINNTEILRLKNMLHYEELCYLQGFDNICGVDEAGRGPLAGPVVAAAVILPRDCFIPCVNDSKKLSEKKRELLYSEILARAVSVGLGIVGPETIERINILNATKYAMMEAVKALSIKPGHILIDGNFTITDLDLPQQAIIKGDSKSYTIAAASIVAKVTRDRLMHELHEKFPEYNFSKNKGYGTKEHISAIKNHGVSPIHRGSFLTKILQG